VSIDDLLGQISRQFIEQLLVLSAQSVAGVGNGQSPTQCQKCHEHFWIEVKQGQVTGTHK